MNGRTRQCHLFPSLALEAFLDRLSVKCYVDPCCFIMDWGSSALEVVVCNPPNRSSSLQRCTQSTHFNHLASLAWHITYYANIDGPVFLQTLMLAIFQI